MEEKVFVTGEVVTSEPIKPEHGQKEEIDGVVKVYSAFYDTWLTVEEWNIKHTGV